MAKSFVYFQAVNCHFCQICGIVGYTVDITGLHTVYILILSLCNGLNFGQPPDIKHLPETM
jgi:hypothetical protein